MKVFLVKQSKAKQSKAKQSKAKQCKRFSLILVLALFGQHVHAQLEEIVVTATKRQESAQEIPLSIEILSGDFMRNAGISDMNDLADNVPNLSVGYGITTESIGIRGLGSGQERSFEQSVGMFIDGMYAPRSRQYQSPFLDVERVEVARGPQSVIHGLNSTAGAISIITARTRPGDAAFLDVTADYEIEYGGPSVVAVGGASLGDTLGVRMAAKYADRDGYYSNSYTGQDEGDTEEILARFSAVFEMNESITIGGKFEYAKKEMFGNTGELFGIDDPNFMAGTTVVEPDDGVLDWRRSSNGCSALDQQGRPSHMLFGGIYHDTCPGQRTESYTVMGDIEWSLPEHTISIVGGHSEFDYDIVVDLDTTADAFLDSGIDENFKQDSVEIRMTSDKGGYIDWLGGFYYHNWSNFNENPATYGPSTFNGLLLGSGRIFNPGDPVDPDDSTTDNLLVETSSTFDQESTLWSLFYQATANITGTFRVTGGLRYTSESKNSFYTVECNVGFIGSDRFEPRGSLMAPNTSYNYPLPGSLNLCNSHADVQNLYVSRTSDNLTPEVAAQWDAAEDLMFYAKYGESAKAGGFTSATRSAAGALAPADQEYQDEQAKGYEAGFKSRWLDNSLEFNFAFYHTEFTNLQVNTFTPVGNNISQRVTNAASVTSLGIELDARWQINDSILLGGSFAATDAGYDNFVNGTCSRDRARLMLGRSTRAPNAGEMNMRDMDGMLNAAYNPIYDPTSPMHDPDARVHVGDSPCDQSGDSLFNAPDYTGNIYVNTIWPVMANINAVADLGLSFSDEHYTDAANEPAGLQDSWVKLSARVGVQAADESWSLAIVGRNLTNEKVLSASQGFFNRAFQRTSLGYLEPPRTIMIQASYRLGE